MTSVEAPDVIAEFTFYAVTVCWFLFAATFGLRKRPPKGKVARRDWNGAGRNRLASCRVFSGLVSYLAAGALLANRPDVRVSRRLRSAY